MRIILKTLLVALLTAFPALAQISAPQINLTGNIGCQGFPCLNNGTLIMPADANYSLTAQETSALSMKVTSAVTLTTTRNLVWPAGRFQVDVENATTGGQSIQVIGASGTGVIITNGQTVRVWNDGTNFVQVGSSGSFAAGGDLSGSSSSQQVIGLKNVPFCTGFTPTNGQAVEYTTGSSPNPCYTAATPSSGGTPGGSSGQTQYNNGGVFGGYTPSGDFTVVPSTGVGTLSTVNSAPGAYSTPTGIVVNAKGLVTGVTGGPPSVNGCSFRYAIVDASGSTIPNTCPDTIGTNNGTLAGTVPPVVGTFGALMLPPVGTGDTSYINVPNITAYQTIIAHVCTWPRGQLNSLTSTTTSNTIGGFAANNLTAIIDLTGSTGSSGVRLYTNNQAANNTNEEAITMQALSQVHVGATGATPIGGCHIYGMTLNANPTPDVYYIDGQLAPLAQAAQFTLGEATLTGGNYTIGKLFRGWVDYIEGYPSTTPVTAGQHLSEAVRINAIVTPRAGFPVIPSYNISRTDTVCIIGNSLNAGFQPGTPTVPWWSGGTYFNPTHTYNVQNYSLGGQTGHDIAALFDQQLAACIVPAARTVIDNEGGTNDGSLNYSAADTFNSVVQMINKSAQVKGIVYLTTVISRGGGGDTFKNALNGLEIPNWRQMGAFAIDDVAEIQGIGADGTFANTACFPDTVHLTGPGTGTCQNGQTGYSLWAQSKTDTVNYLDGSTLATPAVASSYPYTMTYGTPVVSTTACPSGTCRIILPGCDHMDDMPFIVQNFGNAGTVTVEPPASSYYLNSQYLLNGSASAITIPTNTQKTFTELRGSLAAGGCSWITSIGATSTTATNLSGGALGSTPYQSAANTTAFIASPTTSGHTFIPVWQPSGSAIAPTALDLALPPNYGSNVTSQTLGDIVYAANFVAVPVNTATNSNNYNSNPFDFVGSAWNGTTAIADQWAVQSSIGAGTNPTSTLNFAHTGSSGAAAVLFPNILSASIAPGTSPICPNGTNGAFTTSGCTGGGGGNTTSTSLTTNTLSKANGSNSIINSSVSDNGTTVSTAEPISAPTFSATLPGGSVNQGAFSIGTLGFSDTGILSSFQGSTNSYLQAVLQNTNAGAMASTDSVWNNDQGTASNHLLDCGINSSGFTGTGSLNAAGAGYCYTMGGDFTLGTGSANAIHILTNGAATDAITVSSANVATLNSPVLVTPALGTPASGNVANLTGTASININGTVGATTPASGKFSSLADTSSTNHGIAIGGAGAGITYTAVGATNSVLVGQTGANPIYVAQPSIDCTNCTNFPAQNYKEASKYATTAALPTATYANGASGVGATLTGVGLGAITIDSATPSTSDRILVKNQASTFQNGIYTVTVVGSVGTAFVLTRSTDFNQSSEINAGDTTFVTAGTANLNTSWAYTGIDAPTMGTTAIIFAQIGGAGSGTVTTTGSPVSGDISKFSGATSITTAVAGTDYQIPVTQTIFNGFLTSPGPIGGTAPNTGAFTTVTTVRIFGSGSTPTAAAGVGMGTSPTCCTLTGTDMIGTLSFSTGTTPTAGGLVFTLTFAAAKATAPVGLWMTPTNVAAALSSGVRMAFTCTTTTCTGTQAAASSLAASTAYTFSYFIP